jgi:predicted nucleic acid-binding protein
VKFWDTSAIVPLLTQEAMTRAMGDQLRADPEMVVWWAARVECASALARLERAGVTIADPLHRLGMLAAAWHEVEPTEPVRRIAERVLRVHVLRAADALQLAAATMAAEHDPRTLEFVTLDAQLAQAASREGFAVVSPPETTKPSVTRNA